VIQKYQALSAHSGRRSCITNLINNDYSLARIKTVSGHSNEKMVERYYDAFRENSIDNRDLIRSLDFNENKKSS
jgi:integrase